jgi:hypothetical protein
LHQSPSISHKHTLSCHTLYIFDKMQVIHVSWKKCEASKPNFLWHVMQLRLKDKDVESIKKKRMLLRFTDLQNLLFVVGKSMNIYHNSFIWVFRVYLKIELETCETRIQVWIWGGGGSGMIGFGSSFSI